MRKIMKFPLILIFLALPISQSNANDITCPPGSMIKGENTPEVKEAWCEIIMNKKALMHGPYKAWYPSGILGNKGQYNEGVATGIWYSWYNNGSPQSEEHYKNGKVISKKQWPKEFK